MRASTIFTTYTLVSVGLVIGLAGLMLYSIERSEWWAARTRLAQESYGLHLELEANVFRLFKQHGDALLIGNRDGGVGETDLQARIDNSLSDIRNTIAREIRMVGEEEIEELDLLNQIEADVRSVNAALVTFSEAGEPLNNAAQIERLAQLLDSAIDRNLTMKIETALAGELAEVNEVIADAAAFREWIKLILFVLMVATAVVTLLGSQTFRRQIRLPMARLKDKVSRLQAGDYNIDLDLGGSREFRDLGLVLETMTQGLSHRELTRAEQRAELEAQIAARTGELQVLVRQLETGEEARKRLMADISHELRTPLAIIMGEADVTLRTNTALTDELSDTLARIRDAARHTNQIVDDMLTVARHEAGQLRLDRRETDLRKILRDAARLFPAPVAVAMPPTVALLPADEVRIRQAILALLQNARRHGGSAISVRLEESEAVYLLVVEDDGPGMSDDEKAQAFLRFFRGSNAAGKATEGSGLGLPIVKTIVEAHGGTVRLEDVKPHGLRVVIELPRKPRIQLVGGEAEGARVTRASSSLKK